MTHHLPPHCRWATFATILLCPLAAYHQQPPPIHDDSNRTSNQIPNTLPCDNMTIDRRRLTECAPLPNLDGGVISWDKTCTRPAAVVEAFPFHDEVIPTSVKLLEAAGADCIVVLKPYVGARQFDNFDILKRWAPLVKIVHRPDNVERFLRTTKLDLMLIETFMMGPKTYVNEISKYLGILAENADLERRAPPPVIVGCHMVGSFLDLYEWTVLRYPKFIFGVMTFHPAQAVHLRELTRFETAHARSPGKIIVSVPFYFGPDEYQYDLPPVDQNEDVVRILSLGELSTVHRNYDVIRDLRHIRFGRRVELVFFGGGSDAVKEFIVNHTADHPDLSVRFYSGNYSLMFALAQSATYIATFIDEKGHGFNEYKNGKLSSTLAVATAFLVPVISAGSILGSYGLSNQIELPDSGEDFGKNVARAVKLYDTDRDAYDKMRAAQCGYRSSLFIAARNQISEMLRAERQSKPTAEDRETGHSESARALR